MGGVCEAKLRGSGERPTLEGDRVDIESPGVTSGTVRADDTESGVRVAGIWSEGFIRAC